MKDKIKYWDDHIVQSHIGGEISEIKKYFYSHKIEKITFVDIGANVGKFYDLLSNDFIIKSCFMVEPSVNLFEYMKEKFLDKPNCYVFNFALSNETKQGFLSTHAIEYFTSNYDGDINGINLGISKLSTDGQKIQIMSGLDFFEKFVHPYETSIDLIKIDTENKDYNVLDSLRPIIKTMNIKPFIVLEHNYHNDLSYEDAKNIYNLFISECNYVGLDFDDLRGSVYIKPNNN